MSRKKPESHSFVLLVEGIDAITAELEEALAAVGCDDALVGLRNGVVHLDFDRQAESVEAAVVSAIRDVESAGVHARVFRVEPDDFVSQAEIARRLDRPRETVRLWIEGERGPAGFPRPYSGTTGRSLVWRWRDVVGWLQTNHRLSDEAIVAKAEAIARVNDALDLRQKGPKYLREIEQLVDQSAPRPSP